MDWDGQLLCGHITTYEVLTEPNNQYRLKRRGFYVNAPNLTASPSASPASHRHRRRSQR
jgi:hypothetical protein